MEDTSSSADDWLRLNRAWWDERAPAHAASGYYDVPGFLAGQDSPRAFEPGWTSPGLPWTPRSAWQGGQG